MSDEKQGKRLNVCSPELTDSIEERMRFVAILDNVSLDNYEQTS